MEKIPGGEIAPDNQQEQELSFNQQAELAKALFDAINARNNFIKGQGGFDTFAEVGQHVDGMREAYESLEAVVSEARSEFDEKITDKSKFVNELKDSGEEDVADAIASMFGVSK